MKAPMSPAFVAQEMGRRIRARRKEAELSSAELAFSLGKSMDELADIEEGRTPLTAEDITNLCPLLEVMPSWFFEGLL